MKRLFLIVLPLLLIVGCSTTTSNLYQLDTSVNIIVENENYEIVGEIEGQADLSVIIPIYPIPLIFGDTKQYGEAAGGVFADPLYKRLAYRMAMYNAIEKANLQYSGGVDALIMPKTKVTLSGFPPFYWKWDMRVKGIGIRLITTDKK